MINAHFDTHARAILGQILPNRRVYAVDEPGCPTWDVQLCGLCFVSLTPFETGDLDGNVTWTYRLQITERTTFGSKLMHATAPQSVEELRRDLRQFLAARETFYLTIDERADIAQAWLVTSTTQETR